MTPKTYAYTGGRWLAVLSTICQRTLFVHRCQSQAHTVEVFRTGDAVERFGRAYVRSRLRRGLWQQPERGVIVCHNGPLSRLDAIGVALAMCPPGSAVGGATALELDGVNGLAVSKPSIVLPEGAHRPRSPRATFHWSTVLDDVDVHPTRTPRRTRPARSIVDEASWSTTDRAARVIVLAGVQQGLVLPDHLRAALARRGACRFRAVISESILDAGGGVHSLPERDFRAIVVTRCLPRPSHQRRIQRDDRHYYLDVAWDRFDVACEIHGIPHMGVAQWDSDLDRSNDVVVTGPRLLVFSSFAIRHRPRRAGDQLEAAMRRGGWRG